jgi:hypothetical protein
VLQRRFRDRGARITAEEPLDARRRVSTLPHGVSAGYIVTSIVDRLRKVGMEFSCQSVGFVQVELCGFLFRISTHFGLYMKVVLLHTKLEVIPFFAASAVFCILTAEAGKQLRFNGIVREL